MNEPSTISQLAGAVLLVGGFFLGVLLVSAGELKKTEEVLVAEPEPVPDFDPMAYLRSLDRSHIRGLEVEGISPAISKAEKVAKARKWGRHAR